MKLRRMKIGVLISGRVYKRRLGGLSSMRGQGTDSQGDKVWALYLKVEAKLCAV
jgi:hypothetical protein